MARGVNNEAPSAVASSRTLFYGRRAAAPQRRNLASPEPGASEREQAAQIARELEQGHWQPLLDALRRYGRYLEQAPLIGELADLGIARLASELPQFADSIEENIPPELAQAEHERLLRAARPLLIAYAGVRRDSSPDPEEVLSLAFDPLLCADQPGPRALALARYYGRQAHGFTSAAWSELLPLLKRNRRWLRSAPALARVCDEAAKAVLDNYSDSADGSDWVEYRARGMLEQLRLLSAHDDQIVRSPRPARPLWHVRRGWDSAKTLCGAALPGRSGQERWVTGTRGALNAPGERVCARCKAKAAAAGFACATDHPHDPVLNAAERAQIQAAYSEAIREQIEQDPTIEDQMKIATNIGAVLDCELGKIGLERLAAAPEQAFNLTWYELRELAANPAEQKQVEQVVCRPELIRRASAALVARYKTPQAGADRVKQFKSALVAEVKTEWARRGQSEEPAL